MKTYFSFLLLLLSASLPAQSENEKARLRELLQERKDRFEEYTKRAEEKNGFFGYSKRDVKQLNDVLIEIVKADNKIMFELDRLLDKATHETKQSSRDLAKNEFQRDKYVSAMDTLNKQIHSLKQDIRSIAWRKRVYKYMDFILIGGILFYFLYWKKKRQAKEGN